MKLLMFGIVAIVISQASVSSISINLLPIKIEINNEISEYWTDTVKRASNAVKNKETSSTIEQVRIQRFLGFLEGRLDIAIPFWWEQCLANSVVFPDGNVTFPTVDHSPWEIYEKSNKEFDLSVSVVNDRVKIRRKPDQKASSLGIGGEIILSDQMSSRFINKQNGIINITAAIFDTDSCYIATPAQGDLPGVNILCLRRNDATKRWEIELPNYTSDYYRGSTSWFSELAFSKNRVLVFSICDVGLSIVSIDKSGGDSSIILSWSNEGKGFPFNGNGIGKEKNHVVTGVDTGK